MGQPPIQCNQRRIEPLGHREMECVGRPEHQIEAANISIGQPRIRGLDIYGRACRRAPESKSANRAAPSLPVSRCMRTKRDTAEATSAAAKSLISRSWGWVVR